MLKPYNDYKMTKYDWMGNIPVHWDTPKIRELFPERKEKVSDKDYAPLSVSRGGVVPQISTVAKSNDGDNRKLVRYGDFVINSRSDRRGSSGISVYDGSVSLINIVLCPRTSLNGRYTHYLLKCHSFIEEYYRNGRGIVDDLWTTRYAEMKSIVLPVPPREEQDQIVRYLDWQVSKINKLISTRKKQIALLDELRRSITCHCVINGVDGNIKRKETEINWIDHIPEHWNVLFLSQVATEQAIKNTGLIEKNLLSLSYGRIVNKDINTAEGLLPASFEGYQIIHPGNIILRLTDLQNDHKSLRVGLSTQTGIITSAYTCLKVRDNILPEYLYLQLHSADICKVFYGMGGGVRQSIGYKDIRKMPVVVPPIEEQKLIVQKIHTLIAPFDTHIGKLNEKILHLSEYRTRLISDVVIGQIDVRDIEVPEFEYIADDVDDVSDDENTDLEEIMEEEE